MLNKTMKTFRGLALAASVLGAAGTSAVTAQSRPDDCRVLPLIESRWGQTTGSGFNNGQRCFNYYIKNFTTVGSARENTVDYAGCVAVALGQLLRHYCWPLSAESVAYDVTILSESGSQTVSLSTMGGAYDWANMPTETSGELTETQCKAIGRLMYDLAVSFRSTFSTNGTYSSIAAERNRILDHFGYKSCEGFVFNTNNFRMTPQRLEKLIVPCLDYGTPVMMALIDTVGGLKHEVLVDGYGYDAESRLVVHANFGSWGSGKDNWFRPDEGFQIDGTDFTDIHECLYNIFPTNTGTIVSGRILDGSKNKLEGATVTVRSGGAVVRTMTTGADGRYAFLLPPNVTYEITATKGLSTDSLALTVAANESTQFDLKNDSVYYSDAAHVPTLANTFGNDLIIPGLRSETARTPVITPAASDITAPTTVSIACETPGAIIRYTTDGSDPTTSSRVYSGSFTVTDSTTVKAIAYGRGMNASALATVRYAFVGENPGDTFECPLVLDATAAGRGVDRNVTNIVHYVRNEGDPVIDQYLYPFWDWEPIDEDYSDWRCIASTDEYHTVWMDWTAPGSGSVTFLAQYRGPNYYILDTNTSQWVLSYNPYAAAIGVYRGESLNALETVATNMPTWYTYTRENEGETYEYLDYYEDEMTVSFQAEQDVTYHILCACPDELSNLIWWKSYDEPDAYLRVNWTGDLVTTNAPNPSFEVPAVAGASVTVTTNGVVFTTTPGTYALPGGVDFVVTYTAEKGRAFASGRSKWTTVVSNDGTGEDLSVGDDTDFPAEGSTEAASFTFSFVMNGHGGEIAQRTIERGSIVSRPEDPTEEGWTFGGWFDDSALTQIHDWSTPIEEDTVVHAKWTKKGAVPFTFSFEMNGHGSALAQQTVESGGTVERPADPSEEGWTFGGWFDDEALTRAHDWSSPVDADAIVYAKWTKAVNGLAVNGQVIESALAEAWNLSCGVEVNWPVLATGFVATAVKVKGLPTGLKLVQDKATKAYSVTGVPTAASKNGKSSDVTFTVTLADKKTRVFTLPMTITSLPGWAVGTFVGSVGETAASIAVTTAGKISGKIVLDGLTWTVKANAYSAASRMADGLFVISTEATSGKNNRSLELLVEAMVCGELPASATAAAVGTFGTVGVRLSRLPWSDKTDAEAEALLAKYAGGYTCPARYGETDVTASFTIDAKGAAKGTAAVTDSGKTRTASFTANLLPETNGLRTVISSPADTKKKYAALFADVQVDPEPGLRTVGIAHRNAGVVSDSAAFIEGDDVKATVTMNPKDGQSVGKGVSVTVKPDKGSVFLGWLIDGEADVDEKTLTKTTLKLTPCGASNVKVYAQLVSLAEEKARVRLSVDGKGLAATSDVVWTNVCGLAIDWPVAATGLTATSVAVKGLPTGLKLVQDKKTKAYSITGIPTAASKNGKPSDVVFTVTTGGKQKVDFKQSILIEALPSWAVGTFGGVSWDEEEDGTWTTNGLVSLSVAAAGKASVKLPVNGKATAFAATGYHCQDAETGALHLALTAKNGKAVLTNDVWVSEESGAEGENLAALQTANWKVEPWKSLGAQINKKTLSYDVEADEGAGTQSGTVVLSFASSGVVTLAGSFDVGAAKPTSVKASAVLLPNGETEDGAQLFRVYVFFAAKKPFLGHVRCLDLVWNAEEAQFKVAASAE